MTSWVAWARWLFALPLVCAITIGHAQSVPGQSASVLYTLDPAASQLYWRVYSDGALARLGHNHVIAAREFSGAVQLQDPLALSSLELQIPVATLVVDDPSLRAQLGDGFTSQPSEDDIAGTRRNMLSRRLLDGDTHPRLLISGTGPLGEPGNQHMALRVTVAGNSVALQVPVEVTLEGEALLAQGRFQLTHEALGLEPFSALMGTLKVAQPLDFDFRFVARRAE